MRTRRGSTPPSLQTVQTHRTPRVRQTARAILEPAGIETHQPTRRSSAPISLSRRPWNLAAREAGRGRGEEGRRGGTHHSSVRKWLSRRSSPLEPRGRISRAWKVEGISAGMVKRSAWHAIARPGPGVASTVVQARATGHASTSAHTSAALRGALAPVRIAPGSCLHTAMSQQRFTDRLFSHELEPRTGNQRGT